jgi:translation initiation factor IF-3
LQNQNHQSTTENVITDKFNKRGEDIAKINRQIRAPEVRVIDEKGEMIGTMTVPDAIKRAEEVGLDLVEVSPNATPPVCKIIDFGKYKYEVQKKKNEARKKQKVVSVKEIKLRPNIDPHDLGIKTRQMKGFLADGDKVKVTLRFRGREMAHIELGRALLDKVKDEFGDTAKLELHPRMEGRQMIMILSPQTAK